MTKDPDTGERNLSFHRLQLKGPNKTGILFYPRHAWRNYLKYQERNEPMPIAIFIGHYPLYYAAASTTTAYGVDEFEIAGGYLGHPVSLVKCETVDLEVPAGAEIVSVNSFVKTAPSWLYEGGDRNGYNCAFFNC